MVRVPHQIFVLPDGVYPVAGYGVLELSHPSRVLKIKHVSLYTKLLSRMRYGVTYM